MCVSAYERSILWSQTLRTPTSRRLPWMISSATRRTARGQPTPTHNSAARSQMAKKLGLGRRRNPLRTRRSRLVAQPPLEVGTRGSAKEADEKASRQATNPSAFSQALAEAGRPLLNQRRARLSGDCGKVRAREHDRTGLGASLIRVCAQPSPSGGLSTRVGMQGCINGHAVTDCCPLSRASASR